MPLIGGGRRERLELGGREDVGQLDQLHAEAEVGLVGAEAVHRLVPGDAGDLARALAGDRLGGVEHRLGDGREHVVLVDEAHLDVELHELVLPVGAQVLVAEAAGDLVVALDPADHQQLLEELRATAAARRSCPAAGGTGTRNSRAPSGVDGMSIGRLDLDEALPLHRAAGWRRSPSARTSQVALHPLAAQVEVAVAEAHGLVDVVGPVVDRERRRLGGAEDLDGAVADLDLAGGQVRR